MLTNLSTKFFLNQFKAKGNKYPIYLRITVNRKKSEVATSYIIGMGDWNKSSQRTKKNRTINQDLSNMERDIYDIAQRLEKEKKPLTAHNIKHYLTKKDTLDSYLLDGFARYIDRLGKAGEVEKDTIVGYSATKRHLESFLQKKKLNDILIEQIDYGFLTDFDLYLLNLPIKKDEDKIRTMMRNTVNKHHTRLRTIILNAIKEGSLHGNPYSNFKLKKINSTRTFLTDEELQSIINHSLGGNESLIKVRDIFIFSVYTGLRFEDAQNLTVDKITRGKDGKYTLRLEQGKTDEFLSIPILKDAQDIINKYDNSPERKILNKVLPTFSNQKLNTYLKVIADLTGISKTLTHHVARHTCATTVLLSNNFPIEAVSKWLGHTNIKTTQVYAKITNQHLQQLADKLEKRESILI